MACHMRGMAVHYALHIYGPFKEKHASINQDVSAFSRVAVGGGSAADIALQLLKQPAFWAALVAFCSIVTSYQIPVMVSPNCLSLHPKDTTQSHHHPCHAHKALTSRVMAWQPT